MMKTSLSGEGFVFLTMCFVKDRIYKAKHFLHDYIRSFDDLATITWKDKDDEKDDVRKIDNRMLGQIPWVIRNRKQIQNVL